MVMIIRFLKEKCSKLNDRAKSHNVNPMTFIIIYLFSFLPYYFGIYLMLRGSGIFSIGLGDLIRFDFSELSFTNSSLIWGLLINRLAWASPYLYIEVVGKNLRWYVHLGIWVWISGSIGYFVYFKFY